jgi:hypothetical protein
MMFMRKLRITPKIAKFPLLLPQNYQGLLIMGKSINIQFKPAFTK